MNQIKKLEESVFIICIFYFFPPRVNEIKAINVIIFVMKPTFIRSTVTESLKAALVGMQGLPAREGASAGDVLHPTAVWNQTLLSHHVVKVTGVELGEAVLLGNVNLRHDSNEKSQLKNSENEQN